RSKGKVVVGVANILYDAAPYAKVLRYIGRSGRAVLVPHAFLTFSDLAICMWRSLCRIPKRRSYPPFADLEISDLIFNDIREDWLTQREAENILIERWIERLKQSGIVIERFIYTFENHTWERVSCHAIRAAYPSAKLIGYQPNGLPLMLLNYFISESESHWMPLPNR